jgi:hypothetical protein
MEIDQQPQTQPMSQLTASSDTTPTDADTNSAPAATQGTEASGEPTSTTEGRHPPEEDITPPPASPQNATAAIANANNSTPNGSNNNVDEEETLNNDSGTEVDLEDLPASFRRLAELTEGHILTSDDGKLETGGIADDHIRTNQWDQITSMKPRPYHLPVGKIGDRYLTLQAQLIHDVVDRKCNYNLVDIFTIVILHQDPHIIATSSINKLLSWRMDQWEEGKIDYLVEDCRRCEKAYLTIAREEQTQEQKFEGVAHLVHEETPGQATLRLFETHESKVLRPTDIDTKTGNTVLHTLKVKHPENEPMKEQDLDDYEKVPELPLIQASDDLIIKIAGQMGGSGGLNGITGVMWRDWLCRRGQASKVLRQAICRLCNWLFNEYVPWAAIRELMACRMIALDKNPGVRPIGIGNIVRRFISKVCLALTGDEAMEACGVKQLASGVSAGIDAAVHALRDKWEQYDMDDDFGILKIDAENGFNEMVRLHLLWTIRHRWPRAYKFLYNCYSHGTELRILPLDYRDTVEIIISKSGIIQGDPIAMKAYAVGTVPIIEKFQPIIKKDPKGGNVNYADDFTLCGGLETCDEAFDIIEEVGKPKGFKVNADKSVLLVRPVRAGYRNRSLPHAEALYSDKYEIETNATEILGSVFATNQDNFENEVGKPIEEWEEQLELLSAFAVMYPQEAHTIMQKCFQAKWIHTLRTTPNAGPLFEYLSRGIINTYLPALFGDFAEDEEDNTNRWKQAMLPYRKGGLSLIDPQVEASRFYKHSREMSSYLKKALVENDFDYDLGQHRVHLQETRKAIKKDIEEMHDKRRTELFDSVGPLQQRILDRVRCNANHRSVQPSRKNGTCIPREPFRDQLNIDFGREPVDLAPKCDGCGADFSAEHALTCAHGGMSIGRHDECRDELGVLCQQALTKGAVRKEPMTCQIRTNAQVSTENGILDSEHNNNNQENQQTNPDSVVLVGRRESQRRGDLEVRNLDGNGVSTIIDVTVIDTDCPSYLHMDTMEVLRTKAIEKRDKHEKDCKQNNKHFIPFVMSVDGCLDKEAKECLRNIARRLSEKWDAPFPKVANYVYSRMSIAVVRANNRCLRGSRIPAEFASKPFYIPRIEDAAALRAYEMLF